ncbi:MAG: NAD-dependent epimerase/dehydratase family protein [Acidimicrobiia bacterium]
MKVVVTGATGNVGRAVVKALEVDHEVDSVVGIARRAPLAAGGRVSYAVADVAFDDLRPFFNGADAVIHLAWHFQPTHDPDTTWMNNCVGSQRVFDAAARSGVSTVVYASSVGAYSPVSTGDDTPRDENWPTHSLPGSCYGREKAYVERELDAFEAACPDVRVIRMRPSFIFGRDAASEQRRIFAGPLVPNRLLRPATLPFLPYPRGLRFQALHVSDVAAAYVAAALGDRDVRGAFNLAAGPVIVGDDVARLLKTRLMPVSPSLAIAGIAAAWHLRLAPTEPDLLKLALRLPLLDTTRASEILGWRPRFSSLAALQEMLRGVAQGAGAPTTPLAPDSVTERAREFESHVGGRDV